MVRMAVIWGSGSPEAEAVCRHCLHIMSADQNVNIFTIHFRILDQYVSWWEGQQALQPKLSQGRWSSNLHRTETLTMVGIYGVVPPGAD